MVKISTALPLSFIYGDKLLLTYVSKFTLTLVLRTITKNKPTLAASHHC